VSGTSAVMGQADLAGSFGPSHQRLPPGMIHRSLGITGILVSQVGLGTWPLAGNAGIRTLRSGGK